MSYWQLFKLLVPETILALTIVVVLAIDLGLMRQQLASARRAVASFITVMGCILAMGWMLNFPLTANLPEGFWKGMLVVGPLSQLIKHFLLVLTACAALLSLETPFTSHIGEYCALLLLATLGLMFMVSTEDILMIFVSLELTSLSLYILTAFCKQSLFSAEASLKYFLFGGLSAAFLLYGLSLLYGLTGQTRLTEIAVKLKGAGLDPLLVAALVLVTMGLGFKVAAVPFQLWAPDVYQGAPTPSAALIASGSKVASFFLLAKVMMVGFDGVEGSGAWHGYESGWVPLWSLIAALSIGLGNLAAIAQTSVKRLLAYSAIAHAGYMIVGLIATDTNGQISLLYYVVTYALATMGAFGVVTVVTAKTGADQLSDFAGLSRRSPLIAFCMLIFILSLAGIPPLAGFFGKFYLFAAALNSIPGLGLLWLVVFALAMSAVSLFYYLQVLKQIYVRESAASNAPALPVSLSASLVLCMLAAGVVLFGCVPNLLVAKLRAAILLVGF